MKITEYLNEEFLKYLNSNRRNTPVPVYKNPTTDDLAQLKKELTENKTIRVLVDVGKKNVYVWDGNLAIHQTIINQLPELSSDYVQLISGITSKNKIDNRYNPFTIESLPKEVKVYFKGK